MSELSPIGTFNSDFTSKSASIGPLVSSTYGKIIDENGKVWDPMRYERKEYHNGESLDDRAVKKSTHYFFSLLKLLCLSPVNLY